MYKGVLSYSHGQAVIDVYFPSGKEHCQFCTSFLRYEEHFKRYSCRLTGEWIFDPFHGRGEECPIVFEGKDEYIDGDPGHGAG